jgi:hypothetical protein
MNAEVFSDAMDVIDIKYVEEAMCYRRKKISVLFPLFPALFGLFL